MFNVRFLIKYEVLYKNMPQSEVANIPVTCKHRFQRLMLYINSNLAFNMNPQVHMSVLEPNQYLVNLQTLQKLNATWYERPSIVSIEAIKGAYHWTLSKKDVVGNFFIVRPRENSANVRMFADDEIPNSQLCYISMEERNNAPDLLEGLGGGPVNEFSLRKDKVAFGFMEKESEHLEFYGIKKKSEELKEAASEYVDLVVRWKMPK